MIMIVFWAIENNLLVYLKTILAGFMIMIVFWSHRWDAVNNLIYLHKDLIVINSYSYSCLLSLVGILWLSV